jgi:replication-associated recombination protein RarA
MIITPIRFLVPPHYHRPVPTLPAPTPDDLFGPPAEPEAPAGPRPLADRLRPRTLEEVVGQDPRYIARRPVRFAVGDIGMADPQALAGWEAYGRRCSPEVRWLLAEVVVSLGTASKYDAHQTAYDAARALVKATGNLFGRSRGHHERPL